MRKILLWFFISFSLIFPQSSLPPKIEEVLSKMENAIKDKIIKTEEEDRVDISRGFTSHKSQMKSTIIIDLKNKRFCIDLGDVVKIIYDGKNLWEYSELLNIYTKTPYKREDLSLESILSSPGLTYLPLTKKNIMKMGYKIESATIEDVEFEGKKSYLIKIKGKENLLLEYNIPLDYTLSLWISSNSYYPIQSEYEMKGGGQKGDSQKDWLSSTSKMRFTINPKVSDDIFVFKPPKGTMEVSEEDLFSSDFFKSLEGKRRSDFTLDSGSLEGKRLSDFTFTLNSLKGEKISLSSFKGKIVIIYFETFLNSDCLPKVLGILQKLHNEYKDKGVIVIWVTSEGKKEEVKKLITQNKYDFTILLDTNGEISYTDRIFLINKEGTIVMDIIKIDFIMAEEMGVKCVEDILREEVDKIK